MLKEYHGRKCPVLAVAPMCASVCLGVNTEPVAIAFMQWLLPHLALETYALPTGNNIPKQMNLDGGRILGDNIFGSLRLQTREDVPASPSLLRLAHKNQTHQQGNLTLTRLMEMTLIPKYFSI